MPNHAFLNADLVFVNASATKTLVELVRRNIHYYECDGGKTFLQYYLFELVL
jgi:hypothetical protein